MRQAFGLAVKMPFSIPATHSGLPSGIWLYPQLRLPAKLKELGPVTPIGNLD